MDEKERRQSSGGVYVLNTHGQELPEPYGAIISDIKKLILAPFISLVTVLYVMK
jgi:hypothetical protein